MIDVSARTDPALAALADQCVMCGLCAPHCPTYHLDRQEAESPRGRIALWRRIATGALDPAPAALAHLDHCLGCLSCQAVCPSQVDYEQILVRGRALLAQRHAAPRRRWLHPGLLRRLARIGALLHAARWMPALASRLPMPSSWRRLAAEMPDLPVALPGQTLPVTDDEPRGRIALFRGCVASVFDRDTHEAARRLLHALGYAVVELPSALCCGALQAHAGDVAGAARQVALTRAALAASGADRVLVSASGCFGSMRELGDGAARVEDACAFIARDERFPRLRFRALERRAALHLPCTQVNVAGGGTAIRTLLARIPQLDVLVLPEQPRCCGAAGSYFIDQPAFADRLRGEKLDQIGTLAPDLLLTSNIGCRIHLGNGLRQRTAEVPVLHPLALLARQLDHSPP